MVTVQFLYGDLVLKVAVLGTLSIGEKTGTS